VLGQLPDGQAFEALTRRNFEGGIDNRDARLFAFSHLDCHLYKGSKNNTNDRTILASAQNFKHAWRSRCKARAWPKPTAHDGSP
jgi:hypothetical protein